MDPLDFQDP
ncbi:hypothetical protein AYI69_g8859, partial [Smittium culicis]